MTRYNEPDHVALRQEINLVRVARDELAKGLYARLGLTSEVIDIVAGRATGSALTNFDSQVAADQATLVILLQGLNSALDTLGASLAALGD